MNIDERIQALTESVELLASFHHDIVQREGEREAKRATQEAERATQEAERVRLQKDRDARIDYLHTEMMLAITRLAHTAEAHNGQLDDHEARLTRVEDKR